MPKDKLVHNYEVEQYVHADKTRLNNPEIGLVKPDKEETRNKKEYKFDPHLDPELQWAGKAERLSFEVPTVSLHVHERIDPKTIIESVKKEVEDEQPSLFATEKKPLRQAVEFYKHENRWSNRLVAGDSLLVMNSLLEKEGMGGKVQTIYFDPPYGIKYGSNFQPFVNKRDVKDGKDEDLTVEPEMIKAFRDTWELGIHSYLSYLRDRLTLAKELLTDSGSIFVQISDENVHRVRLIMDEVFGGENFVSLIVVLKTAGKGGKYLDPICDYILFYSKNIEKVKYKQLFNIKSFGSEKAAEYKYAMFSNGLHKPLTKEEMEKNEIPLECKLFRPSALTSQTGSNSTTFEFDYQRKKYKPSSGGWKTSFKGLENLAKANRLLPRDTSISYIRYLEDFPVSIISNMWDDVRWGFDASEKRYVVETNQRVIQRCILMTSDPGDLVFDPTCGSGTTAYVAEQWGRRWITCDTSRVAISLAKQRLMTASFDYYELKDDKKGVTGNFKYKTVPHITLKSIANNGEIDVIHEKWEKSLSPLREKINQFAKKPYEEWEIPRKVDDGEWVNVGTGRDLSLHLQNYWEKKKLRQKDIDDSISRHADQETLVDQPIPDKKRTRVTGPFTVEAVPSPVVKALGEVNDEKPSMDSVDTSIVRTGATLKQSEWRSELARVGVRAKKGNKIEFAYLEVLAGTKYLHAVGETKEKNPKRVVVSFGPEFAPYDKALVELAIREAEKLRPKAEIILFCAFQFEEEAAKDIEETNWEGVTLLKAQMNTDLFVDDLKKKRSQNDSFWLIGQPDVELRSEEWVVDSLGRRIMLYGICSKLSGLDSMAKINKLSPKDLSVYAAISERGDLWNSAADKKSSGVNSGKHSGRTSEEHDRGISSISWNRKGFTIGSRDFNNFIREVGLSDKGDIEKFIDRLRRNKEIIERTNQISIHFPLTTKHYSQIEVLGFDYYDPKTNEVKSGGKGEIAMWMLDSDYDGRSIFPKQVFFPLAGDKDGWAKLGRDLKADLDEELLEAFRTTVSLPFNPGKQIAVKIVDNRGIESIRVFRP